MDSGKKTWLSGLRLDRLKKSRRKSELKYYEQYEVESFILRDHLALDRTMLANERTFLAYLRTAIMVLISGFTLLKLFGSYTLLAVVGIALIPVSLFFLVFGYIRYLHFRRQLSGVRVGPIRYEHETRDDH
ncbi:DUF202 domain-containing protein [candidate division KSB1 bacterium]|nr:DUF202 domain-containing protein [candidate division KSB1 bacterium]